jgi:hypothetical protein
MKKPENVSEENNIVKLINFSNTKSHKLLTNG